MIVIALDTNFVVPHVFHGKTRNHELNILDRMLFLQSKGLIKVLLHRTTQAEIYAILKAGRFKIRSRSEGKRVKKKIPHHVIMNFVHIYSDLFDVNFMKTLRNVDLSDEDTYKDNLFIEVKYHLGMGIDQSKEYLRNKGIIIDNCNNLYDFHIMVTAIQDNADILVTANVHDFPDPLGKCRIVSPQNLPHLLPTYP
ncbi:hypothetical protein ACOI1C_12690 [Bacillus sp. DJP31]|uniref:hypothetical protein n=1 Tax=Bacillus sp. DJP31 TaxID=3409789 RepID=UPI003BB5143C